MVKANMKVLRIFLLRSCTKYSPDCKGYNKCQEMPDVESPVGIYHDDILNRVDFVMSEMAKRDLKLVIAMHDRWSLGYWRFDSYVDKYHIKDSDPSPFYETEEALLDFQKRVDYIMTHKNPYFDNREWRDLSEVIFTIQPENEPQFRSKWLKNMTTFMKNLCPKIPISLGGVDYSYKTPDQKDLIELSETVDIYTIHDYEDKVSEKLKKYNDVFVSTGTRYYLEEFGFEKTIRYLNYDRTIRKCENNSFAPWVFWCIGEDDTGLNVQTDERTWTLVSDKAKTFSSTQGAQDWPEIWN